MVGIEKCNRFSVRADILTGSGGLETGVIGLNEVNISENRGPDIGVDVSVECQYLKYPFVHSS